MTNMRGWRRLSVLSVAAVMTAAACGGTNTGGTSPGVGSPGAGTPGTGATGGSPGTGTGGEITVMSLWGGSEEAAFQDVLAAFTEKTGINVAYESDRQTYATTLQSRITGGNPPDIAIIPGIGFLRRFAKDGSIKTIQEVGIDPASLEGTYPQGFLDVGKVDGEQYALPAKYNSKSTMWYRPDLFEEAGVDEPGDWEDFKAALDTLASETELEPLGLGAKDDWTLTDWFESIYIRQAGVEAYDRLFSAEGDWTDPSVQEAVDTMLEVLNDDYVAGSMTDALGRGFTDGIAQVFAPEPQAAVYYEGGFVGGIATGQTNTDLEIGETIDWFPFPAIGEDTNSVTFGGDVIAALTTDPGVREFIEYITTTEAAQVWAETGAVVMPHTELSTDIYPNDLVVREAEQLANAENARMDGSDLLPSGGPSLGAELQKALQGQEVDWQAFQDQVKATWDAE